jgi:16S rRNA (guanine527-N7)-methyltransferase
MKATQTPPDVRAVRLVHERILERMRRTMDLVGPGPLGPHFEDASAVSTILGRRLEGIGSDPGARWADLGSGAGFPGVALAAHNPHWHVDLVESRQKKAIFLGLVLAGTTLGNATVIGKRVENLPEASYEGVISRAFAPPARVLELASRLLVPGGAVVLLLAREATPAIDGWSVEFEEGYALGDRTRRVAVLRATTAAPT